ncbi:MULTISPECIES: hypothetical protein [Hyphobacterium]|uniref:Uncharacterized protein n=1 Tax=Hyphobacterium vulgare TaxID=1736751 RepID=A0ABV6ZWH6_9PROT
MYQIVEGRVEKWSAVSVTYPSMISNRGDAVPGRRQNMQLAFTALMLIFVLSSAVIAFLVGTHSVWHGVAWLIGSLVCLAAGIGTQGARHPDAKSRLSTLVLCAFIYAVGLAITHTSNPVIEVLGFAVSGFWWATAGAVLGGALALSSPVSPSKVSVSEGDRHLIEKYADILATDEEDAVRSTSELPAPKPKLDRLLREAIRGARDFAAIDAYGAGFVGLGLFQPDVSPEDRSIEDRLSSLRHRMRSSGGEVRMALLKEHAQLAKRLTVWREIVDAELAERKHALEAMVMRHPLLTAAPPRPASA